MSGIWRKIASFIHWTGIAAACTQPLTPHGAILAGADTVKAYRAIGNMARSPETAAYLAERLKPPTAPDPTLLTRLVGELDSPRFAVREKATES